MASATSSHHPPRSSSVSKAHPIRNDRSRSPTATRKSAPTCERAARHPPRALYIPGVHRHRDAPPLTPEELTRYSRHLILPGVGPDGQRRLKQARVLIIGAGGLGSPIAMYLAAAGIGHLGIVDSDVVDRTNLQRQILHGTSSIGRRKTESAAERLHDINPNVAVTRFDTVLTSGNALEILADYDIIVDGTRSEERRA